MTTTATIAAVNLGQARALTVGKETIHTGIFKQPVAHAVTINQFGLAGDHIADNSRHGGLDQAVYLYSAEAYAWWSQALGQAIGPGTFGENLTLSRLGAAPLRIGDRLHIKDVVLEVTFGRVPCATLAARMGNGRFVKQFVEAGRPGIYTRVIQTGRVQAGDAVTIVPTTEPYPTVAGLFALWYERERDPRRLRQALEAPIAERARAAFQHWLAQAA